MASSDLAISVRGLSKQYIIAHEEKHTRLAEKAMARLRHPLHRSKRETFLALNDVSFDVKSGEVVGIIGRNGAGKSTLLKILSRITEPTAGEARLYGRVGSLLEVGTGFHPELTGRENVYLNGAILGMRRAEIRKHFDEIVAFSEIEKFLDTPVKRYSSGMYVRLAFAVAAHLNPEILIVDEVLAVGDAEFQRKCLGKMQDVSREGGRTVLFVSHNMAAVNTLCPHAILLSHGTIEAAGDTRNVVAAYLQPFGASGLVAEQCLSAWPDRYGSGAARIVAARLRDTQGKLTSSFVRGLPLTLEFDVDSPTRCPLHLGATCTSERGERVLLLSHSDDPSFAFPPHARKATVRFTIPELPLQAGRFAWTLSLHTPAMMPLDVVQGVLAFDVHDCPDTCRPYRSEAIWGLCAAPASWSAVPTQN